MNKIAVFLATGFEEIEALTVVDICRRAELSVITVSIMEDRLVTSSHGISVMADAMLEKADFDSLDMIVLPGGMPGTTHLEACEPLMKQVDRFYKEGRYISAICAAPSIFGHKGYLKGRNACCYPSFEAHLGDALVSKEPVEVSEHVTTSRGMGTAIDFGLAIVERFKGKDVARHIAEGIVYR